MPDINKGEAEKSMVSATESEYEGPFGKYPGCMFVTAAGGDGIQAEELVLTVEVDRPEVSYKSYCIVSGYSDSPKRKIPTDPDL
jgi:hypothetical protein